MAGEAIKGKKQTTVEVLYMECKLLIYLMLLSFTELTDFLMLTPFLSVKPVTTTSEKEKKITHSNICWTSRRIAFFCPSLFSKSWKRSVKPSGPSWMEDMTTSSASWHHVWDWRNLIWRTPYWKEIRQYILGCFFLLKTISCHFWHESPLRKLLPVNWTYIWFWDTSVLFKHVFTQTIREWCFWLWMLRYALWQLERTEQFFAADGLPHLMFFYQEPEPVEAGNRKVYTH